MKKLQKLKVEGKIAKRLTYLPFQVGKILENFYKREQEEIEKYGGDNPDVDSSSLIEMKDILKGVFKKDGD